MLKNYFHVPRISFRLRVLLKFPTQRVNASNYSAMFILARNWQLEAKKAGEQCRQLYIEGHSGAVVGDTVRGEPQQGSTSIIIRAAPRQKS